MEKIVFLMLNSTLTENNVTQTDEDFAFPISSLIKDECRLGFGMCNQFKTGQVTFKI